MASPAVVGTPAESNVTTDNTSHAITRVAGVSGQLSIVVFAFDGGSDVVITPLPDGSLRIAFDREDVEEEAEE